MGFFNIGNFRKFTGHNCTKAAINFIQKRRELGQVWEVLENNEDRTVVKRRRHLE